MKRVLTVGAFAFGLALLTANTASSHNWGLIAYKHIDIKPFHFGIGAASAWLRGAGEPKNWFDPQQWGFLMQKHTASVPSYAAAGAEITGGPKLASALSVLSFDISGVPGEAFDNYGGTTHGYCNNGGPRFNVYSTGNVTFPYYCALGCAHGDKTQDATTGWWTIAFKASHPGGFVTYPGCEGGISGTITGITLLLDEGNDVVGTWGVSPGDVIVDNIRVNNSVAGRPDPW